MSKDIYNKICPITGKVVGTIEVEEGRLVPAQLCQHEVPVIRRENETPLSYNDRVFASGISHLAVIVRVDNAHHI